MNNWIWVDCDETGKPRVTEDGVIGAAATATLFETIEGSSVRPYVPASDVDELRAELLLRSARIAELETRVGDLEAEPRRGKLARRIVQARAEVPRAIADVVVSVDLLLRARDIDAAGDDPRGACAFAALAAVSATFEALSREQRKACGIESEDHAAAIGSEPGSVQPANM